MFIIIIIICFIFAKKKQNSNENYEKDFFISFFCNSVFFCISFSSKCMTSIGDWRRLGDHFVLLLFCLLHSCHLIFSYFTYIVTSQIILGYISVSYLNCWCSHFCRRGYSKCEGRSSFTRVIYIYYYYFRFLIVLYDDHWFVPNKIKNSIIFVSNFFQIKEINKIMINGRWSECFF